jgi:hypothetical protein
MIASMSRDLFDKGMKILSDDKCQKACVRQHSGSDTYPSVVSGRVPEVTFHPRKAARPTGVLSSPVISSPATYSHTFSEATSINVHGTTHQLELAELPFWDDSNIVPCDDMDSMEAHIFSKAEETGGWEHWLDESLSEAWLTSEAESSSPQPIIFQAPSADQVDMEEITTKLHEHKNSQGHTSVGSDTMALTQEWDALSEGSPAFSSDDFLQLSCSDSGAPDPQWSSLSDAVTSVSEDSVDEKSPSPFHGVSENQSESQGTSELSVEEQVTGSFAHCLV